MPTRFEPKTTELTFRECCDVANVEYFLDRHQLGIRSVRNGRWYRIRRNGQTKRWKRDQRVEIPCKVGFLECFTLHWNAQGEYILGEVLEAED